MSALFLEAAENGDWDRMLEVGERNTDVENEDGQTAAVLAAMNGHLHIVKNLVESQDPLPPDDPLRNIRLHAAWCGHLDIVKYINHKLAERGDLEDIDDDDPESHDTAIYRAAQNGHLHVVEYLSPFTSSEGLGYALQDAVSYNRLSVAKWLYANTETGDIRTMVTGDGEPLLRVAVMVRNPKMVLWLLSNGVDVQGALVLASRLNDVVIMEILLRNGANTRDGTVFFDTIKRQHLALVELFLVLDEDLVYTVDGQGFSVLHHFILQNDLPMVKRLVETMGVDTRIVSDQGISPLMAALDPSLWYPSPHHRGFTTAKWLLKHNHVRANDVLTKYNQTAVMIATSQGNWTLLRNLLGVAKADLRPEDLSEIGRETRRTPEFDSLLRHLVTTYVLYKIDFE